MNDYSIFLALTYFKERQENYLIEELSEILGYNNSQTTELIQTLLGKEYIAYVDNLLVVTKKGITLLISNNCDSLAVQQEDFLTPHIDRKHAMPIDVPYVPINFTKKFKG